MEENRGLRAQNQGLAEEAAYAKELASSAAVELKNLAEEVTKLSKQNARQAKELMAAQEMAYQRAGPLPPGHGAGRLGRRGRSASRGQEFLGGAAHDDLEEMRAEVLARRQREAALEAALGEKEAAEEELRRRYDEAKKREAALENELAGMWVVVAKLKKGAGAAAAAALGGAAAELNADEKPNNHGFDPARCLKENNDENKETVLREIPVVDASLKQVNGQLNHNSELEPLLSRLKVKKSTT